MTSLLSFVVFCVVHKKEEEVQEYNNHFLSYHLLCLSLSKQNSIKMLHFNKKSYLSY